MAKSIKNYTSSVPAMQSMSRIEEMLVSAGAHDVRKTYNDGACTAFIFILTVPGMAMPLYFKLPAKVDSCFEALWRHYLTTVKKPSESMKTQLKAQALRTAWKIMHDWVELQLSLIELEQLETMEAFLPYLYNDGTGETFYEHAKGTGFKQLTNG